MSDYSNSSVSIEVFQSVKNTVELFDMIRQNDSVLIGVSGGPDSVALLHVLRSLSSDGLFTIAAAHLNHCLRGTDSDNDMTFVQLLCDKLDVPCYTAQKDVRAYKEEHGCSLEEAARHARYEFYRSAAKAHGCNKIALGHHREDNAELMLMHLFRGSGPLGMSGIPFVRQIKNAGMQIIRPFMEVSKSQLIARNATLSFDLNESTSFCKCGSSATQGPHQVAQKSSTKTFSLKFDNEMLSPSKFINVKSGAFLASESCAAAINESKASDLRSGIAIFNAVSLSARLSSAILTFSFSSTARLFM